jgi:hypothetical protein
LRGKEGGLKTGGSDINGQYHVCFLYKLFWMEWIPCNSILTGGLPKDGKQLNKVS